MNITTRGLLMALFLALIVHVRAAEPAAVPTKTVQSIAELKDVNPANNQCVYVLDYYNPRKTWQYAANQRRGGGVFRWVTDVAVVDDGGLRIRSNINTNGGIWERVLTGQEINVKMFGAVGDGVTDDTAAIQRALDNFAYAGNRLQFPNGQYIITNTLVFTDFNHLTGEGNQGRSCIILTGPAKQSGDILRTRSADVALHGNLNSQGACCYLTNAYGTVDFAHGMIIEDLSLQFGTNNETWGSGARTGAGLCLARAGDGSVIRNIMGWNGGFGVRCIGGGTPGLRVENSSFFYQTIAAISIEGINFNTNQVDSIGGPVTLTGIAGDCFGSNSASLIQFTNYFANATITDPSVEGTYGGGVIRCDMPANTTWPFGEITVRGGTCNSSATDYVVITNRYSSTTTMPNITIEPGQMYGVRYIISDLWANRNIPADTYNTQLTLRRPIVYRSTTSGWGEKRSLLVIGDTAYYSFIPTQTNKWYRVLKTSGSDQLMGGRLAINSYCDSSEFSFNNSPGSSEITVTRKTKNTTGYMTPLVSHARGYCWWNGGGYSHAVDIYVQAALDPSTLDEQERITITLPIEGHTEISSGVTSLIDPVILESTVTNSFPNPAVSGETYSFGGNTPTGPISLLR